MHYRYFYKLININLNMTIDESVDCYGTCSGLSLTGCRLIPHDEVERDEVERQFDDAIKKLPSERYAGFMNHLQQNYPTTYKIFRAFGF